MVLIKNRNYYEGLLKSRFESEKEVEDLIFQTPDLEKIFGEELYLIGRQVEFLGINDTIDILAINKKGKLVIIETKLSFLSATNSISQVTRYSGFVDLWDLLSVKKLTQGYYLQKSNAKINFEKEMNRFLDVDFSYINQNQKIVLIGSDENKKLTGSCRWLINQGVDIELINIEKYRSEIDDREYVNIQKVDPAKEIEVFPPKIRNKFDKEYHLKSSEKEIKELVEVFVEKIQDLYGFDGPFWDKQTFAYFTVGDERVLDFRVNKTNIYIEIRNLFLYDNPVKKRQLISILEEKLDFSVEEKISFKF